MAVALVEVKGAGRRVVEERRMLKDDGGGDLHKGWIWLVILL